MIAASVDDLPEPVGPVTSTMPFFNVAQSPTAGGSPSSSIDGIFCAIMRMTIANVPRWRKTLTRKRQRSGSAYDRSVEPVSISVRRYVSLSRIRSRAMPAVSSGRSAGSSATGTVTSSP